jgi:hypothetical protein
MTLRTALNIHELTGIRDVMMIGFLLALRFPVPFGQMVGTPQSWDLARTLGFDCKVMSSLAARLYLV